MREDDITWILEKDPTFRRQLGIVEKINGAPLSTQDIIQELKNPYSFVSLALRSYVVEISLNQQIEATQLLLAKINADPIYATQRVVSDSDSEIEEENRTLADDIKQLNQQLTQLETLRDQRNNLLDNWQVETQKNMDKLFKDIDKLLPEDKKLNDQDKNFLRDIVDRQAKATVYAPAGADQNTLQNKAAVNVELNAWRLIDAKKAGIDPDEFNGIIRPPWMKHVEQHQSLQRTSDNLNQETERVSEFTRSIGLKAASMQLKNIGKAEDLIDPLETIYKSVQDPSKSAAQNQQAYEFALMKIMKDVPENDREKIMEFTQSLLNNGNVNQQLAIGAFGVMSELEQQAQAQQTFRQERG